MNKKRILTTSIIPWSELSGSDTVSKLLDGYGAENVASIYVRGYDPTSKSCDRYFRINEASVLKSILIRNIKTGEEKKRREAKKAKQDETENKRYRFFSKHRFFIFLLLRELGWKLGKWKSKELNEFIDNFSPDVLICTAEQYIYMNRINLYIVKKTKAKVISIIWDDNFTYKSCTSPFDRFFRFFVKRQTKKIVSMSSEVLAISPKTKKEVDDKFGIDSIVITKPIQNLGNLEYHEPKFPLKLLYAGNFYIGRDRSLKILADQIKEINKDGHYFDFDIYVNNIPYEKTKIENEYTRVFSHVDRDELDRKIFESDILVFAESLDKKYAYASRLSFSTKIVDYLGSGKAILAVGKPDVAAMEYLKDNDAALCASSKSEIFETLKTITDNLDIVRTYAEKAYLLGMKEHSREQTAGKLQNLIERL